MHGMARIVPWRSSENTVRLAGAPRQANLSLRRSPLSPHWRQGKKCCGGCQMGGGAAIIIENRELAEECVLVTRSVVRKTLLPMWLLEMPCKDCKVCVDPSWSWPSGSWEIAPAFVGPWWWHVCRSRRGCQRRGGIATLLGGQVLWDLGPPPRYQNWWCIAWCNWCSTANLSITHTHKGKRDFMNLLPFAIFGLWQKRQFNWIMGKTREAIWRTVTEPFKSGLPHFPTVCTINNYGAALSVLNSAQVLVSVDWGFLPRGTLMKAFFPRLVAVHDSSTS